MDSAAGADLGGGCRGCAPPPKMTCGFLINTVQSASQLYKICFIIWYVFSAVHIMLLPSRKPSSSYSLLKFVYVTSQLRHSLVMHPLLRKILDPPLSRRVIQLLHSPRWTMPSEICILCNSSDCIKAISKNWFIIHQWFC